MIICRIQLHPFAGITERTIDFKPGLNVILGPNEAGKSTLIKALRTVLLEPTDYKKKKWEDELSHFVPRGGGDTFRVSLTFQSMGATYQVTKQWGSQRRSELTLPGNQLVSAADTVQQQLASILELKAGTWDHILFAHQAKLPETLKQLGGDAEEKFDLAQLLRKSAFVTDGVSIEKLGSQLATQREKMVGHWDEVSERPEGNRGIDKPWKQGVGSLLKAWYLKEQLQAERVQIQKYENSVDQIVAEITELTKERDELEVYVQRWQPIVSAVHQRQALEARATLANQEEEKLRSIAREWPTLEERQRTLQGNLGTLSALVKSLDEELNIARLYAGNQAKRSQLRRAQEAIATLQAAEASHGKLKAVSDAQLQDLATLQHQTETLHARLSAGKLQVKVLAHRALQLEVQPDLQAPAVLEVPAGGTKQIVAGGRVIVAHPDWRIEITSGEIEFEELQRQLLQISSNFEQKLKDLNVETFDEALRCHNEFDQAQTVVGNLRFALDKELNGESLESLANAVGPELPQPPREVESILVESAKRSGEHDKVVENLNEIESRLNEWIEKHRSLDHLQDMLLDARAETKKLTKELELLPQLPSGIDSLEDLVKQFQQVDKRLRNIKEDVLPDARQRKAELGNEPEQSLIDVERQLRDAESAFEHQKDRWQALKRIEQTFQTLKVRLDAGTLDPWLKSLHSILDPLTGGHYQHVNLDNSEAHRGTDLGLPYELLSMGTKSCLGLAVRISMAQHFLDGKGGFLILDDPMVDLDAERQQQTVEIVRRFAADHQVILVTCHRQHAALFGGELISVERTY